MDNLLLLSGGLDPFSPYMLIIEASVVIVLSHLFGILSEKTNIPSVLMLVLTGILIKLGMNTMQLGKVDLMPVLDRTPWPDYNSALFCHSGKLAG